jgi:hypothetical protein
MWFCYTLNKKPDASIRFFCPFTTVLVDGHDHLRILHAREMLDRPRDTYRNIKLRRDNLAGLPDLPVVGREGRIHRCTRRAERRAQFPRERIEVCEIVRAAESTSARYHGLRARQIRTVTHCDLPAFETRQAAVRHCIQDFDRRCIRHRFAGAERSRAYCQDLECIPCCARAHALVELASNLAVQFAHRPSAAQRFCFVEAAGVGFLSDSRRT